MAEPPKKKRKLPSLDDAFSAPPRESDSPELHQGRKRAIPHAQGQWASHVYLELTPTEAMRKVLRTAFSTVSSSAPPEVTVHSLLPAKTTAAPEKVTALHVSLSRPLILQTNQRSELRAGVAKIAREASSFSSRYATFAVLTNDDRSRRFLGIEIGQGYDSLNAIVTSLNSTLKVLRLPPYYETPRFHTSIAWSTILSTPVDDVDVFDASALDRLEKELGKKLRDEELWVGELCLKIGKEETRYRLGK